ncbi:MAG: type II toxin-antitoxin system YafQ family toxin [Patescibacteria group bacterium]
MKIRFKKSFWKYYAKLTSKQRKAVDRAIVIFRKDPFSPKLRNHSLRGKLSDERSIVAGYDLRIIFREEGGYCLVIMITVGTHDEVYK